MLEASEFIRSLELKKRNAFTTAQAVREFGESVHAVRAKIRQLRQAKEITTPFRTFHVLLPSHFHNIACLPAKQFINQLMTHLNEYYYVGILSAASLYGAAHQAPQVFQVMVQKYRRPIICGRVFIQFIVRSNIRQMPVNEFETDNGIIRYATPEVTAFDVMGYPKKAAGYNNVATIFADLAEKLCPKKLVEVAKLQPVCWSQRMGHLMEFLEEEHLADALYGYVSEHAKCYTPLVPYKSTSNGKLIPGWKLIVNAEVDPD